MIKANELRIGNWFYSNGKPVQFNYSSYPMGNEQNRVIYFYPSNPGGHNDPHNNLDNLKPILLTPEILEKAGFELRSSDYVHEKMYGILQLYGAEYMLEDTESAVMIPKPIKYLHQLQNLYFALTGTELEINL